ncbi:hypothetical protein BDV3_004907 [Batrachochytrium dendrobatidis]
MQQRLPVPIIEPAALKAHFEDAVNKLLLPQTRVQGEQLLKDFRKLPDLYNTCKYILETSTLPAAQFHAAIALQDALPRIYIQQTAEDRHALQQYLVQYLVQRCATLQQYVMAKVAYTAALAIKLGYLQDTCQYKDQLLSDIIQLLFNPDWHKRHAALQLLIALLEEFSSKKATALGLPWNFHHDCQVSFERSHLQVVFESILRSIHNELRSPQFLSTIDGKKILNHNLFCAEKILSWTCISGSPATLAPACSVVNSNEEEFYDAPNFPATWRTVLLSPNVLGLFFQIAMLFAREPSISTKAHKCVIQLAGLHGDVLANEGETLEYVHCLLENTTKHLDFVFQTITDESFENSGELLSDMSQIGKQLLARFQIKMLIRIPSLGPFLQGFGKLTIVCLQNMVDELDDSWSSDTAEELLAMWCSFVQDLEDVIVSEDMASEARPNVGSAKEMLSFISTICFEIFHAYLDVRLRLAKQTIEEDEDVETHFKDLHLYGDQLLYIATIARVNSAKCLVQLGQLLTEHYGNLSQIYVNPQSTSQKTIALLNEQIHWLTLIAGHVLADSADGEKPLIPTLLQQLSKQIEKMEDDPCIALPTCIFNILELVTVEPGSAKHAITSPLIVETLLWFVERWGCTYLFVDPSNYSDLSPSFVNAFGKTGGAPQATEFLLDKVQRNFVVWHSDVDVVGQILSVIEGLSGNKDARNMFLTSATFNSLVQYFLANLSRLPATLHSNLIQTIAYIYTHATGVERTAHFTNLITAIENMLVRTVHRPDFSTVYQLSEIQEQVVNVMEMYGGLALAADETNMVVIFEACARQFPVFVKLLDLYHNYPDVEFYILQFFRDLVKYQALDALQQHHYDVLYKNVWDLIEVYAKNEVGRKRGPNNVDSELNVDLSILLEMLTGLITSEYEGLDRADVVHRLRKSTNATAVDVVQVVFFGVNALIPLITKEMLSMLIDTMPDLVILFQPIHQLQYPQLCKGYIGIVTYIVEYFPDRLMQLSDNLISCLFKSLVYGLNQHITSLSIGSLRAMESIALYLWSEQVSKAMSNSTGGISIQYESPQSAHIDALLHETLTCMLFKTFDSSLINSAADAVSSLVSIRRQSFQAIAGQIIQSQPHAFSQQLTEAFSSLSAMLDTHETHQRSLLLAGKLKIGQGCGSMYYDPRDNVGTPEQRAMREMFGRFLINVRGLVMVK